MSEQVTVDELAQLIGVENALRVCAAYGRDGGTLYLPHRLGDRHPLRLLIGNEAAEKLAWAYRGETLRIPDISGMVERTRNESRVLTLHAHGLPLSQIAFVTGMHRKTIRKIIGRSRTPEGFEEGG